MIYSLDKKFDFGRYRDSTVQEIYAGLDYPTQSFFNEYINRMLMNFPFEFTEGNLQTEIFHVNRIEFIYNNHVRFFFKRKSKNMALFNSLLNHIFFVAEDFPLKGLFESANDFIREFNETSDIKFQYFGHPNYITWCIHNESNNNFCIDDLSCLEKLKVNYFDGIKFQHIADNVYKYQIFFKKTDYKFPDKTIARNNEKRLLP